MNVALVLSAVLVIALGIYPNLLLTVVEQVRVATGM
jgi:NADH:ubiquinone oxidoreductase subunit 4 (subunit M)